jgi:hypothetical protein
MQAHNDSSTGSSFSIVAESKKRSFGCAIEDDGNSSDYESCDFKLNDELSGSSTYDANTHGENLQKYYYSERERYLPLANITRTLKDVLHHSLSEGNVRVTKEGILFFTLHFLSHVIDGSLNFEQPSDAFKKLPRISSSC